MTSWDLPALAPVDATPTGESTQEPASSSAAPLVPRLGPRDEGTAAFAAVTQPPPSCRANGQSSAPTEGGWPAVHAWLVEAVRRRLLGPALQAYLAAPERRSPLREESFLKASWVRVRVKVRVRVRVRVGALTLSLLGHLLEGVLGAG